MTTKTKHRTLLALLLTCAGTTARAQSPQFTTLYTFSDRARGVAPDSSVAVDKNGVLYGTTAFGGTDDSGVLFSVTPPASPGGVWTEAVLYNFPGNGTIRAGTGAPVIVDNSGIVYGAITGDIPGAGNGSINGGIYSLTPPSAPGGAWRHTTLCSYRPLEGPQSIAMGKGKVIYAITSEDGANLDGFVSSCAPPSQAGQGWTSTVLYNLPAGGDTGLSSNIAVSKSGTLYTASNATFSTGGSVFSLKPPASPGGAWTETTLYGFPGFDNGANTAGLVIGNGVLYGATSIGGSGTCEGIQPGCGVAFELTPPTSPGGAWTYTLLHTFENTPDGAYPDPLVAGPGGVLYGSTYSGGTFGFGTLFSLTPPSAPGSDWTYTLLYQFTGGADSGNPNGLTLGPDGTIFGTTTGTVFSLRP